MRLEKISKQNQTIYKKYVADHQSGSFLQSLNWGNFQNSPSNRVFQYLILKDGEAVGSMQVYKKTIPKLNKFYVYCPYGPLLSEEITPGSIIKLLKKEFRGAIHIRLEPKDDLGLLGTQTIRTQPGATLITDLSADEDQLLANMHQKTRYNIRLSAKRGVVAQELALTEKLDTMEALELFTKTSERQKFKDHPPEYYQKLLSELSKSGMVKLYVAKKSDMVLASAIMIDFGSTRTYLFGGSSEQYKNIMAPYALHWKAMTDAKKDGLLKYDWWGIETSSGSRAGFAQFKLRFGGSTEEYPPAIDIVRKQAWYTVYRILRKLNRLF